MNVVDINTKRTERQPMNPLVAIGSLIGLVVAAVAVAIAPAVVIWAWGALL